ncbi:hypothetical protein HMPREF0294_1968 [Corynebacterium glucuronolyticum ATCC 51867]|nr:hypothetical protein HMPREF0294_1968 [Corynebacterium glucuronolyticum ATCC 51867]
MPAPHRVGGVSPAQCRPDSAVTIAVIIAEKHSATDENARGI